MIFISVVFFYCLNCYYHFSFYSRFIQMSCCFLLKIFFNRAEFHSFCKSQVFFLMFDFNFYFSDVYWQPFKNKLSNCICFELFRQVMVIISGLLVMSFRATRFQHYLFFFIIFQTIIWKSSSFFPLFTDSTSLLSTIWTFAVLLLNYAVFSFLHWREVLVFLQVIRMIVTLSHSKECFCCFVAKLRCCQVFLHRKRSSPVCGFITLILTVCHSNKVFFLF